MKIAFFADGGKKTGLGHIMRTLVIAKELAKENEVYYIDSFDNDFEAGYKILNENNINIIKGFDLHFDYIVADTYTASNDFFQELKKHTDKILYIDDMNKLDFYDVDILLNRNIGAETYKYNTPKNCKLLLGGKYSLLREEFRLKNCIKIKRDIYNILITLGGGDVTNVTPKILNILKNLDYTFHVVIGDAFSEKNKREIEDIARNKKNIILHYSPNMSKLFKKCELAISACGGTIYELSCMGIPTIGVAVAENQIQPAKLAEKYGIISYVGSSSELNEQNLLKIFARTVLFKNRRKMSKKQKRVVNKFGIDEIIKNIR